MIHFNEVTKSFQEDFWKKPKIVLDRLSFSLEEGTITGFLGANGAGKTTSIKALLGFISIDSGSINFSEALGASFKEVRSKIGYFPESPYFYPYLTGMEFCQYLGALQGISKNDIEINVKKWGEALNISYALHKKVRSYSKGMLQRLGFLSALIHSPSLIILDEPLSGLDPIGRKEFKDVLQLLNKEGRTVFFSSHIVSDVEEICENLVVIKEGKHFYSGKTSTLLEESKKSEFSAVVSDSYKSAISKIDLFKTVENQSNGMIRIRFSNNHHGEFMKWVQDQKVSLIELKSENPTLEEVIYDSSSR
ncbi:MAG: ABC transporter ATP-binding protein [Bdellovibrionota bacterium]|nr:ABC transporter ATP-binding protein [Bdellovibrionota bacterium]